MTTYSIEESKSSRAKCKKCGEVISKGQLRIGTHNEVDDKTFTSWHHVSCFQMTKRLQEEYSTKEDFLSELVQDHTQDGILGTKDGLCKIADELGTSSENKKGGKKERVKHTNPLLSIMEQNALALQEDSSRPPVTEGEPAKKKLKISPVQLKQAETFKKFAGCKVDELKDVLRWNKAPITGNKDVLLLRIIDGEVYGRLGRCPICVKGRLKLCDEGDKVECKGFYNEDVGAFEVCYFSMEPEKVPRLPWFDHEPNAEEEEQIKQEQSENNTTLNASSEIPNGFLENLRASVNWDVSNKEGIKNTSLALSKFLGSAESPIAIPTTTDESKVRMEVGKMILQNKDKSMEDIVQLLVQKYGLRENKEKENKSKEEMIASICQVEANGKIYNAFRDLAAAYSAEGNRHAANTYRKVVNIIKDLNFEITVDNAKGLGTGKNKIQGMGKKSAEYMQEFLETGTIQKLEEKKAAME